MASLGGALVAFEIGRGIGTVLEDSFHLSDKIEDRFFGGMDKKLEARILDDEGKRRLSTFEREKDVARELGVTYETVHGARRRASARAMALVG